MVNSLKLEFIFLFIIIPTIFYIVDSTQIIFLILYLVFFISLVILKKDKTFDFSRLRKKNRLEIFINYLCNFFNRRFFLYFSS